MSYHYAFEAARLLEQCIQEVLLLIDCDESGRRPLSTSNSSLYDIKESLTTVEVHLFHFFLLVIDKESSSIEDPASSMLHHNPSVDLGSAVSFLRQMLDERQSLPSSSSYQQHHDVPHTYYPTRSVADSLLFRLNVALQLCLVRIDDARSVIGRRRRREQPKGSNSIVVWHTAYPWRRIVLRTFYTTTAVLTLGSCSLLYPHWTPLSRRRSTTTLVPLTQLCWGIIGTRWLSKRWGKLWMRVKLAKSADAIEEWCRQWSLIIPCTTKPSPMNKKRQRKDDDDDTDDDDSVDGTRNRRLIEYALHDTSKVRATNAKEESFCQ